MTKLEKIGFCKIPTSSTCEYTLNCSTIEGEKKDKRRQGDRKIGNKTCETIYQFNMSMFFYRIFYRIFLQEFFTGFFTGFFTLRHNA